MRTALKMAFWTLPVLIMIGCSEIPPPPDITKRRVEEPKVLTNRQRAHIGKDVFSRIDRVSYLPKEARDEIGEMADPGQPWSVGCVGNGPRQRLIFAAISDDWLLVYSEFGGIVHGWSVEAFSIDNGRLSPRGHLHAEPDIRNIEQLKKAVASSKVD